MVEDEEEEVEDGVERSEKHTVVSASVSAGSFLAGTSASWGGDGAASGSGSTSAAGSGSDSERASTVAGTAAGTTVGRAASNFTSTNGASGAAIWRAN